MLVLLEILLPLVCDLCYAGVCGHQVSGTGGPKWTLPLNGLTHPICLTSFQVTCGLQLIGQLDILGDLMTASSYKQKVYTTQVS